MTSAATEPVVLGLDFGGTKLAAAVATSDGGTILGSESCPTEAARGAEQAVSRGIAIAQQLADRLTEHGQPIVAVGVATMGITEQRGVRLAPTVPGWRDLEIPALLTDAFPQLPVAVENDVRAATLAEQRWGELKDVTEGIYVNFGSGVGAGIVVAGQLLDGAHRAAGEIGYLLQGVTDLDRRADERAAPFEEAVGGHAVRRRAEAELGRGFDFHELAELSATDAHARELFLGVVDNICLQLANLAIALDPEVVVLGGGYVRTPAHLVPAVQESLGRALLSPPRVCAARFGGDSALRGALAVAADLTASGGRQRPTTSITYQLAPLSTRERGANT